MMRKILTASFLAAALSAFSVGAAAQHPHDNAQGQTNQGQSMPGMMGGGMMGGGMMGQGAMGQGMMGQHGMMGMMGRMMAQHQHMTTLMSHLMQSMTAIQGEKASAALRAKIAEHMALLEQMHTRMMQQGNMMHEMAGQIRSSCPAVGQNEQPASH